MFRMCQALICNCSKCECTGFIPDQDIIRHCAKCKHDWIPHAVRVHRPLTEYLMHAKITDHVSYGAIFDISSLVLWGTNAIPVRLHILLECLLETFQHENIREILAAFDWTCEQFTKGFKMRQDCQNQVGSNHHMWVMVPDAFEPFVIAQFLRFSETKLLAIGFLEQLEISTEVTKFIDNLKKEYPDKSDHSITNEDKSDERQSCSVMDHMQTNREDSPMEQRSRAGEESIDSSSPAPLGCLNEDWFVCMNDLCGMNDPRGKLNCSSASCAETSPVKQERHVPLQPRSLHIDPDAVQCLHSSTPSMFDDCGSSERPQSRSSKRRVKCVACMKTFCDKGALKIHFSAVHLREMHQCTVKGCNMLFSSRRSRNRHSANPNPKLHVSRSFSNRYHTMGPLITENSPSIAGMMLAEAEKLSSLSSPLFPLTAVPVQTNGVTGTSSRTGTSCGGESSQNDLNKDGMVLMSAHHSDTFINKRKRRASDGFRASDDINAGSAAVHVAAACHHHHHHQEETGDISANEYPLDLSSHHTDSCSNRKKLLIDDMTM